MPPAQYKNLPSWRHLECGSELEVAVAGDGLQRWRRRAGLRVGGGWAAVGERREGDQARPSVGIHSTTASPHSPATN
jgi:hypothetical protein